MFGTQKKVLCLCMKDRDARPGVQRPVTPEIANKQGETGVLAWAALLDPRLRPPFANNEHDSYVEGLYEFVEVGLFVT